MEKYGYKNISSRNEFENATKNGGRFNYGPVQGEELTTYDFVDINKKGNWGMPGQTRYYVKTIDDLIKANEKTSKTIEKKRNPNGYVGW